MNPVERLLEIAIVTVTLGVTTGAWTERFPDNAVRAADTVMAWISEGKLAFAGFWLISAAALVHFWAGPAQAQQPAAAGPNVKLGIVSFLTGPAAAPFGIPGRNAAEIVIEALIPDLKPCAEGFGRP